MTPIWMDGEKDRRNELKMQTGETVDVGTQEKITTTYIYFL